MVLAIRKYFLPPRVNDRFCAIPEGNLNASKMQTTLCSINKKGNIMDNEIKRIYSGSIVNAEFIGSVLADNDIQFLIRNFQEESLCAGWAASTIKGDASVYVFEKDYDKAMLLLDEINAAEMEEE